MNYHKEITTDHITIRNWIEARNGTPARLKPKGLNRLATEVEVLCIDHPGCSGRENLEQLDWNTFFRVFDAQKLAFVCPEQSDRPTDKRFEDFVRIQ